MAVTVVQSVAPLNGVYSGNFSGNVTAGNTIFVAVSAYNPGATMSTSNVQFNGQNVTGAAKLTERQDAAGAASHDYSAIWMLPNVTGGATGVSVTGSNLGANPNTGLILVEVAGLGASPALDQSTANGGNSVSPSLTTAAITSAPEFVLAHLVEGQGTISAGPGAGWSSNLSASANSAAWYQTPVSSGGTYAASFTLGAPADWVGAIVTIGTGAGGSLLLAVFP